MKTFFCVILLTATGVAASADAGEPGPATAAKGQAAGFAEGWTLRSSLAADPADEDRASGSKGADMQRSARWTDPSPARVR